MGKTRYTRTGGRRTRTRNRPDPPRETSTRLDPYRRVRVGSGIPVGTGRPAQTLPHTPATAKPSKYADPLESRGPGGYTGGGQLLKRSPQSRGLS